MYNYCGCAGNCRCKKEVTSVVHMSRRLQGRLLPIVQAAVAAVAAWLLAGCWPTTRGPRSPRSPP
jgi:hypothetical protein